jgi:hypothetical protein
VEKNYATIKKEALAMVYASHKLKHYLLGNMFVFYMDHMVLLLFVKKTSTIGTNYEVVVIFGI